MFHVIQHEELPNGTQLIVLTQTTVSGHWVVLIGTDGLSDRIIAPSGRFGNPHSTSFNIPPELWRTVERVNIVNDFLNFEGDPLKEPRFIEAYERMTDRYISGPLRGELDCEWEKFDFTDCPNKAVWELTHEGHHYHLCSEHREELRAD
jgi:hypothetical protein